MNREVMRRVGCGSVRAIAAAAGLLAAVGAVSVPAVPAAAQAFDADPVSTKLKQQTLARLMQRVTVDLTDARLEDVVTFIESVTNTDLEPLWLDDRTGVGLDPEMLISVKVDEQTALTLIEQVLERADRQGGFGESTWQFTKTGAFEFGPKERLNRRTELVIYDITDMLTEAPDYDNAPEFDLNTIFQQGGQTGGGGGGASPFGNTNQDIDRIDREEKVQDIIDLIVTLVEPEQWLDNGGEAGSIRHYRGSLIVRAPDYIHRQLVGYPWWPAEFQSVRTVNGRRYVTLSAPTSLGTVDFINTMRVFAAGP